METVLRTSAGRFREKPETNSEQNIEDGVEGFEMLVGNCQDSEDVRDEWIDEVEKLLEFNSLGRAQQHERKNFENPSVHNEKKYFERR